MVAKTVHNLTAVLITDPVRSKKAIIDDVMLEK